jgi:uncharacterized protein (DUF885 family)
MTDVDTPDALVPPSSPSARLTALTADAWAVILDINPTLATSIGLRGYDDRLADPTPAGRAAASARYAALLGEAEALAADGLDADDAEADDSITLAALRETLTAEIAALDCGLAEWNVDHMDGLPTSLLTLPDYQRLETPEDGQAMLARWRAMEPYIDASIARLRAALAEGRVASVPTVDRAVAILADLLAEPIEDWPLLAPLAGIADLDGWTLSEREQFAAALKAAVTQGVAPAFERLRAVLTDEIRPAARPASAPGIGHVEGGAADYRRLIRYHTSLDLEPEALHATGLAEIERIDAELVEFGAKLLGTSGLAATLAALRGDPAVHFATRSEVFAKAASSLAAATAAIPAWFGRLPQAPCVIEQIPAHEEAHSPIAYYRGPAEDGSRPGQFYVNTSEPQTRPRYEAEALAYHESIPGHHLQIAIAQELEGVPEFRRHLGTTAYIEGWGLYSERLAGEMGLYASDLDRIGVASFDAWRAARLVVDTGMHVMGWSRDQAITFMTEHTALGLNNIANEVDRYIAIPGQALAYKTGQMEIVRLRASARARLGERFDIRSFHDAVLGSGAVPLPVLAGIVDRWVAGQQA